MDQETSGGGPRVERPYPPGPCTDSSGTGTLFQYRDTGSYQTPQSLFPISGSEGTRYPFVRRTYQK